MKISSSAISNGAFTLACIMFIALGAQRLKESWAGPPVIPARQAEGFEPVSNVDLSLSDAALEGASTSDVILVEFSDFQCPFCGRYSRDTYDVLKKEFIEKGRIRYAFMHFPLPMHPLAEKAGEAAECAGAQGHFWEMHDRLFADQQSLGEDGLFRLAATLRLDPRAFRACLSGEMIAKIQRHVEEGRRVGVTSTPTFMLGRSKSDGTVRVTKRLLGAQPVETFRTALLQVVADSPTAARR